MHVPWIQGPNSIAMHVPCIVHAHWHAACRIPQRKPTIAWLLEL